MPRTGYRVDQVNEFLRVEVADLIRQERDELNVGLVSITEVQTSADLRHARVFISTLGGEAEREARRSQPCGGTPAICDGCSRRASPFAAYRSWISGPTAR